MAEDDEGVLGAGDRDIEHVVAPIVKLAAMAVVVAVDAGEQHQQPFIALQAVHRADGQAGYADLLEMFADQGRLLLEGRHDAHGLLQHLAVVDLHQTGIGGSGIGHNPFLLLLQPLGNPPRLAVVGPAAALAFGRRVHRHQGHAAPRHLLFRLAAQGLQHALVDQVVAVLDNAVVAAPVLGEVEAALQHGELMVTALTLGHLQAGGIAVAVLEQPIKGCMLARNPSKKRSRARKNEIRRAGRLPSSSLGRIS